MDFLYLLGLYVFWTAGVTTEKEGIIADLVQQMQNVQKFLSEKVSIYIQILAHLQCFYPTFSKTGNRTKMLLF